MKKISVIAIVVWLSIAAFCSANTIYVPDDQPTIQAGIDAAVNGDTVIVRPGTYTEKIDFNGKAIVLESKEGAETTVISGSGGFGLVVNFSSAEGADTILRGFTIQNGSGWDGGGIVCDGASPVIDQNIIKSNFCYFAGGGIYCMDSSAVITNNLIMDNTASGLETGLGGGICSVHSELLIQNNTIIGNSSFYAGGGVYCSGDYVTTIRDNIFRDNKGGIGCSNSPVILNNLIYEDRLCGIKVYGGSPRIVNNIIRDNQFGGIDCYYYSGTGSPMICNNIITANGDGGISCSYTCEATIVNCTISANSNDLGGGMQCREGATVDVSNTIFWDNSASNQGQEIFLGGDVSAAIHHSNVMGGSSSIYISGSAQLTMGAGMIEVDPLFVDAGNNDYHINYNSPCRNAGHNSVVIEATDFEGDPRIASWAADIGADEFHNHLYCTGDFMAGGSITGKLIGLPDSTPVGLFIGSGVMDPPLQHNWGDFYLEAPWLLFPLLPIPSNGVLEIPATLPGTPAPYDIPMQALIEWELTNLFVIPVR